MENSGQPLRYLTIEEILKVAERHVGNYQFLHEDQLSYIVDIVGQAFNGVELFLTLPLKAAVYAHHIIKNHIFVDGNKRVGMTCAIVFLRLNGCVLHPDIDDTIIDLGLKIADGTIKDLDVIADHIQSWIW